MKVIVTGATSFIGAAAVRLLLHQGHQVCGVVRPGSKNLSHLWEAVPEAARERLAVAELDLKEIRKLEQAPEAAGADNRPQQKRLNPDLPKRPDRTRSESVRWLHNNW